MLDDHYNATPFLVLSTYNPGIYTPRMQYDICLSLPGHAQCDLQVLIIRNAADDWDHLHEIVYN